MPVVRATDSFYNCCIACIRFLVSFDVGHLHTLSKTKAYKQRGGTCTKVSLLAVFGSPPAFAPEAQLAVYVYLYVYLSGYLLSCGFAFVGLHLAFTQPSELLSAAAPVCLVLPPSLCPSLRAPDLACTGTSVCPPVFSSFLSPLSLFVSVC